MADMTQSSTPVEVTQEARDAAEEWESILNHRYSEYEGDAVSDLAQAFQRIIDKTERETLERAAKVAEEWRDENKAAAAKAEKEGNRGFAAELRTAAVECNALSHEIRSLTDRK